MPSIWSRAIAINRRASWPAALILGVWVAWSMQPLTAQRLLLRTQGLQFSYADIYSELHEQPFGFCDSYYAQREDALNTVRARAGDLGSSPLAAFTLVRDYDAALSTHYEEDCRVPWHGYQNPANFQKVFAQDYPLYFLISQLRLTEIRLALMQFVAGWLGVVAIALLSVYFWRSPLAPVVALGLTSWLAKHAFIRTATAALPGAGSLVVINADFLLPAATILLIVALLQPALRDPVKPTPAWTTVGLALAYGFHTLLYYAIDPPVARTFALIGLAYVGLVGVSYRRWQVVGGAALALAVQLALDAAISRPGLDIYSAVTRTNHLASEAYTRIMVYMGFFERPSPFGLFYMDEIFGWVIDQDPVLVRAAPFMAVHHSYAQVGRTMLWTAISREPLMVIDAVFRRILIQIFYRQLWFSWVLTIDWTYTWTLLLTFAVNVWAWRRKALFLALTPITLCLLVNQFAVNTAMTLIHTHSRWNVLGVMMMFAVAPLYLFAAIELLASTTWRWPNWRAAELAARPLRLAGMVMAVAGSVWLASLAARTLRQERTFVRSWMELHKPPAQGADISSIVDRLESIRAETGDARGEIAMWTAAVLTMYEGRGTIQADQRAQLDQLRYRYYKLAIDRAPDNPHYLFSARFLQIAGWESYLLQGLQRFPQSVYAPGAAAALHFYAKGLPDATRESVARQYETLTGRFLSSGRSRIPGFQDAPAVVQTAAGPVTANTVARADGRSGLQLTMAPGAIAFLSDVPTYGSPAARVFLAVDLQEGDVEPAMAFGGQGRERTFSAITARVITKDSQRLAGRYQFFEAPVDSGATTFGMWLRAGAKGATVEVHDYYPIADNPAHYYRSGLMERVRRRAARQGHSR